MIRNHYTLIEMIAVLSILMIVFGISAAVIGRKSRSDSLDSFGLSVRRCAAECRRTAMAQGRNLVVEFDPKTGSLLFDRKEFFLSNELKIYINDKTSDSKFSVFTFFADGSAAAQEVELKYNDESIIISVSPLTGLMRIIEGSAE